MNKLNYIIGIISLLWISACTDFVEPAIPYNDFQTGVYLRTIANKANTFNFFDLDNAKWNIVIEVVGENEGKDLVKDVEVYVRRRRGAALTAEVKILTIAGSEFGPYPERNFPLAPNRNFPAKEILITLPQTLTALGLTKSDVNGGDNFEYRLVLNTNDGRTFNNTNLSADISGGAFYASPFFYRIPVICPSELEGTMTLSTTGWCGSVFTGTVELRHLGAGVYNIFVNGGASPDFSLGAYNVCYGPTSALPLGNLRLNDACNQLFYSGTSQWGEVYTFNSIVVEGNKLTLDWKNDYDPEAGVSVLTRTDGKNWPPLKK